MATGQLLGASRITAITSTGLVRKVHKQEPAAVDNWKYVPNRIFSQKLAWGISNDNLGKPVPITVGTIKIDVPERSVEIAPMELPWKDNDGALIKISFGTCLDVSKDTVHGKSNLAIYVGAGFPLTGVKDTLLPWLMNDATFWNPGTPAVDRPKREPGYYWNKPLKDIQTTIFSTTTLRPLVGVRLAAAEVLKVTNLFRADEIVGCDWMGDLYLVQRAGRWFQMPILPSPMDGPLTTSIFVAKNRGAFLDNQCKHFCIMGSVIKPTVLAPRPLNLLLLCIEFGAFHKISYAAKDLEFLSHPHRPIIPATPFRAQGGCLVI